VADLPPERLHDTLPGFHHTPGYLAGFDDALGADVKLRASAAKAEREFVYSRRSLAPALTGLIASKELPLRVVHNDPKVNNIMVHAVTGEALCMLDLDTVKPGIVHFDFGDCVRSAANPAGENALDLDRVGIDLALFEAVAKGYLREAGAFLTKKEIALLPLSVKVITFELGIRFLADHLRGDTYFKTAYPGHNLHRARVQFRLLESIEAREQRMTEFISRAAGS
jgi:Ser/Thr protein kinase RdoA (MazF antagonist)